MSPGEAVLRERPLPGAVLRRVAASHVRVGVAQAAEGQGEVRTVPRHEPQQVAGQGGVVLALREKAELAPQAAEVGRLEARAEGRQRLARRRQRRVVVLAQQRQQRLRQPRQVPLRNPRLVAVGVAAEGRSAEYVAGS